jgi:hypothetical protein
LNYTGNARGLPRRRTSAKLLDKSILDWLLFERGISAELIHQSKPRIFSACSLYPIVTVHSGGAAGDRRAARQERTAKGAPGAQTSGWSAMM